MIGGYPVFLIVELWEIYACLWIAPGLDFDIL